MSSPGWYPDPSGQPHSFRFWDGQGWSQQTTDNPYSPPPGQWPPAPQQPVQPEQPVQPAEPEQPVQQPEPQQPPYGEQNPYAAEEQAPYVDQTTQFPAQPGWQDQQATQFAGGGQQQPYEQQGYGQQAFGQFGDQQWSPAPAAGGGNGGGSKKALWIVLAAVVVIALIVGGIIAAIQLTGDDDNEASGKDTNSTTLDPSDEPSEEASTTDEPSESSTEEPSDEPSATEESTGLPAEPAADICIGGDPELRGSHPEDGNLHGGGLVLDPVKGYTPSLAGDLLTFATDTVAVERVTQTDKWISIYSLGALPRTTAGTDLEAAARAVLDCMANSADFYESLDSTTELTSEAITIDGLDAWAVRSEITVTDPTVSSGGDVAQVIVVDTGDADTYGLFASVVPLGDDKLLNRLDSAIGTIAAE